MDSKVSLYIPCYNARLYIAKCLGAAINQTCRPDEILVIDDGPGDDTAKIASRYPVRVVKRRGERGLPSARNEALRLARNDLVASLDADCVPQADWLERLIRSLNGTDIAGACGKLVEKYTDSQADKWRWMHMRQDWGENRIINPPFLFGSNNIFRKEALLKAGLYDERYVMGGEDSDVSKRLLAAGYRLIYEPRAVARHIRRDTIGSVLRSHWNWNFYLGNRMPVTFNNLARRLFGNLRWAVKFLINDLSSGAPSMSLIDLLLFFDHSFRDIKYYLLRRTKPKAPGKIRVLEYISTGFIAGEVQQLLMLAKGLNKEKFKVDVACFEGAIEDYLKRKDMASYEVGLKPIKFEGGNRFNTFLSLFKLIREGRYHIVHIHPVSLGGIPARIAARLAGAKIITTESGIGPRHNWESKDLYSFIILRLLHPVWNWIFLDHVIAISGAVYGDVIRRERMCPQKVSMVHYGVETDFFRTAENSREIKKSLGIEEGAPVVGTVCRLEEHKGVQDIIKSFSMVAQDVPQAKLVVVGDGVYKPFLERTRDELGLNGKVIFTGWREDVAELYGVMDVFVLASRYEPLGLAVLEAMASGKPVVATRTGGIVDIIEDGKTGFLIEPNDINALKNTIGSLLKDKELSLRMGSAAEISAREKFDTRTMVAGIEKIYEETCR